MISNVRGESLPAGLVTGLQSVPCLIRSCTTGLSGTCSHTPVFCHFLK